ncbi:MAG: branched-chain amino acid ABC transporter permease [Alphaproteobacteria bacterium]|nr:branched-chain amino acid ABC transporter permease [Alphaproteobacteria bacterium]
MLYREAGQFKSSYRSDQAIFPIFQDRIGVIIILLFAFLVIPMISSEYMLRSIFIPFLIFSLAAIGLNILTGYAGQLSLGTAGFMAVGAFAAYNLVIRLEWMNFIVAFAVAGVVAAAVGIVFGLPSLRIKGFYLAVVTLAAQFFIEWLFTAVPWFTNYSSSGVISAPPLIAFGYEFESAQSRYVLTLAIVAVLALLAKNMVRTTTGRAWMAIRDMDIAAEIIGIRPLWTKLQAFAISSFYCGVAGALWAFVYLGTVEPQAFDINRSFEILFMIIIGGLGSILGSFLGAAFIVLLPIALNNAASLFTGSGLPADIVTNFELIIFGLLIIFFLIVEPHGLARLWQIGKEKLRLWPFPY